MMTPLPSPKPSGKRTGKQIREGLGLRGSKSTRNQYMPYSESTRSLETAGYDSFGALLMPKVAASPLRHNVLLLPPCFPAFRDWGGEAKTAPEDRSNQLISLRKSGAGEGIRTLDPNLGKVPERPTPCYPTARRSTSLYDN